MKMTDFKYSLFFDCHTLTSVPDFGCRFSAKKYIAQIKSLGVDYLTCHARCNQGNAYYNTKFGKRHPSLQFDLIRELGEEAHRNGIKLTVYFNGSLSETEILEHPAWRSIRMFPEKVPNTSPFYWQICYNSAEYRRHLLDMALELAKDYPVDGFFFDCLGANSCVCPVCVEKMRQEGVDVLNERAVRDFSIRSVNEFCRYLHQGITAVKPDAYFFFNGRPFEDFDEMDTHYEAECLPTGGWGYEYLPVLAHYLPAMAKGKQILNMTGRFNTWGDFGGLRTQEGMEYDMFYGLAHGMRPDISDHIHPSYEWPQPVVDAIKPVYDKVRQYDKWAFGAWKDNDIAVVAVRGPEGSAPMSKILQSTVRMLTELKVQFDVVTTYIPWDKYKLLIFPDNVLFTDEIASRVRQHIARGGKVFATGTSGLKVDNSGFALPELWPATYVGPYKFNQVFYQPEGNLAKDFPDMPMSLYADGQEVRPAEGAKVEMYCVQPYGNKGWDGLRPNYYVAPHFKSDVPFLLRNDSVIYMSANIFDGYASKAPRQHKDLVASILAFLYPEPKLKLGHFPSFGRAFVQYQKGCTLVHLMSYCPEKRGNAIAIEDRPEICNAEIALRLDGKSVTKVFSAPDGEPLPMTCKDGYCQVTLPYFAGYALLVFETK
ncbi:MAG: beta-galactosidase trimerization domain-containing protein [Victivallales bacterium]|nr:beta-galactosidase trimerization domain-containing protein [Victivallales bacterium]